MPYKKTHTTFSSLSLHLCSPCSSQFRPKCFHLHYLISSIQLQQNFYVGPFCFLCRLLVLPLSSFLPMEKHLYHSTQCQCVYINCLEHIEARMTIAEMKHKPIPIGNKKVKRTKAQKCEVRKLSLRINIVQQVVGYFSSLFMCKNGMYVA